MFLDKCLFFLNNMTMKFEDNFFSKFLFGEVYRRIYDWKFSFKVTPSGAVNIISDHISDNIPPQMKNLNMVIPILMYFSSFVSNWTIASSITLRVIQQNVTYLMTSNNFRQYTTGYTVANF